jgi:hypothetical protein
VGVHYGPVHAGVIGIKYPRYSFFGDSMRLVASLMHTALPNSVHTTEMVAKQAAECSGASFLPYTRASFYGLGNFRTYLLATPNLDPVVLKTVQVGEYLAKAVAPSSQGELVVQVGFGYFRLLSVTVGSYRFSQSVVG